MQTARIFNIQKFSINDGPGIRTTVFFKGCPLRCRWCANPESQLTCAQLLWDEAKCCHCRTCVRSCGREAITFENGKISLTNQNDFSNCYSVQIKDLVNSSTNLIKMYVPFSTSGTLIEFTYSYEAAGLYISIKDCKCEEEHTETIKYID